MKIRRFFKFFGLCVAAIIIGFILGAIFFPPKKVAGPVKPKEKVVSEISEKVKIQPPAKISEPSQPPLPNSWVTKLENATVWAGEGIEHTFIRQLVAEPKMFGWTDDVNDPNIQIWAGRQAHLIAISAGYVNNRTGEEVRIKLPGKVAFPISMKEGKISVQKIERDGNVEAAVPLAENIKAAKFQDKPGTFEYIYKNIIRVSEVAGSNVNFVKVSAPEPKPIKLVANLGQVVMTTKESWQTVSKKIEEAVGVLGSVDSNAYDFKILSSVEISAEPEKQVQVIIIGPVKLPPDENIPMRGGG